MQISLRIGAHVLQADPSTVRHEIDVVKGPHASVSLGEIARIAHLRMEALPDGADPLLDVTVTYEPGTDKGVFSYATHGAVVSVDPSTGNVKVLDFAVVEDCGTIVNPMIVDGQIRGGVIQGIGTAVYEELTYDELGQPGVTTIGDYLVPVSVEMPDIKIMHMHTPTPHTEFGIKGMGEGGAIAPPAAIANAIRDALVPLGVELNETPITPRRVLVACASGSRLTDALSTNCEPGRTFGQASSCGAAASPLHSCRLNSRTIASLTFDMWLRTSSIEKDTT